MSEILLAEDNPADVYLIREALREHGVEASVRVASDGREVLRLICPEKTEAPAPHFDLIILDLNLPRHDGIEILEQLRGSALLSSVPVVVLTSSDSPRDQKIANQLGATRYLRKPSNLEQFLALGEILKSLMDGTHAASVCN
jgi:CheY-like chemotaxis protein